jgi:hypothetical protein
VEGEEALLQEITRASMEDLSGYRSTPAFHMRRIENTGAGLSAVLFRIHHVIGDGISLV